MICIAGKNNIAVNAVKFLLNDLKLKKEEILICGNKNDIFIDTWQPSLKLFAKKNNIRLITLEELYNIKDLFFFSLEFDKIIKIEKFSTNNLFNIHFSLLPSYKGMYTSIIPILNGEKYTGVTLHEIDNGIDTGNIIDQDKFPIEINDTSRDLYYKYLKYGLEIFKRNFLSIINNNFKAYPQSPINSTYFSRKYIDFRKIKINFNKTSFQIHNQIRAFIFKEYQLPIIQDKKIIKSILTDQKIKSNYKEINENKNEIILSGIDGYKIILKYD